MKFYNRTTKITVGVFIAIVAAVTVTAQATAIAQQPSEYLDSKNWTPIVALDFNILPNPGGIVNTADGLRLDGYFPQIDTNHPAKNAEYTLNSKLSQNFENKLVDFTVVFDGEFADKDNTVSFLAFGMRANNPNYLIWGQPAYAVYFSENTFILHKFGKGQQYEFDPTDFVIPYSRFPALGFNSFPKQKEIKITYGVVNEGAFPRIILKINDVQVLNKLDNKNGPTIKNNPNNVFAIALVGTNKRVAGDETSHSNLLIKSIDVK